MRILILFSIIFYLQCGIFDKKKPAPTAINGVIDLRNWDFKKDGTIPLDGEWKFYWGESLTGIKFNEKNGLASEFIPISVPSSWKGEIWKGKPLPGFGYATYKLKILLPKHIPTLTIHNFDLSSSYRFSINGELFHEQGRFSSDPRNAEPSYRPLTKDLPELSEETEFVYEISNYHYGKGGFWESSEIGERDQILNKLNHRYQVTSFIAGSIFLWALYHLGLYFMRREDKASLFISLFSFFLVLRILTTGERLIGVIFPEISMDNLIRLEFSTAYIAAGVFAYFYRLVFPETLGKHSITFVFLALSPFIISLFFSVAEFSQLAIYYQVLLIFICIRIIFAILKAFKYGKTKSVLSLVGFIFIFLTVLNDTLYQNNIINTTNLIPFGFLGFILFQGYILSYGFTRAYSDIAKLKENLEISNGQLSNLKEGLEDLIVARTKELEESKINIQQLNEFARAINSTIRLEIILEKAYQYLKKDLNCDSLILFLIDEKKEMVVFHKGVFADHYDQEVEAKFREMNFELNPNAGIFYLVYKRNRSFSFSKVRERNLTKSNNTFVRLIGNRPGMIIPLASQGKVVGLLTLFKDNNEVPFTKQDLQLAGRTGEAIATSVTNSILIDNLNTERNIAEITKIQMEDAKNEVVKLNEFTKRINSESLLSKIIDEMFDYIQKTFKIEAIILQLLDYNKNEFYTYNTTTPENVSKSQIDYAKNLRIPLNESGGFVYQTYLRKKSFYVSNIPKSLNKIDKEIITNFKLSSFVVVPLIVQNQVIGMAYFTSYNNSLKLKHENLRRISGFCDQIAGAVQNSLLLQLAEEEKKRSELARAEIQKLNEFAKRINSLTNLEGILAEIFAFIKSNYEIENCVLFYLDKEYKEFRYLNHSGFNLIDDETVNYFKNLKFPLNEKGGFVYQCYMRKKYFYMKRIPKHIPYEIDREIIQRSKSKSLLVSPMINNDEVVAMAVFGITDENKSLNKEERSSIIGVSEHIASAINNNFLLHKIEEEKKKSDALLLNILPKNVAEELQLKGRVNPVEFENVTILITGFSGFSQMTAKLTPEELIEGLDLYFSRFDEIIKKWNLEKLKMTGDMFIAAGGLPIGNFTHPIDACLAALSIKQEVSLLNEQFSNLAFKPSGITIAVHSGPVVAGVIGKSKFSYDIWGKTVTQTQAIRRATQEGIIHVSQETIEKAKSFFDFEKQKDIVTYEGESLLVQELMALKHDLGDISGLHPNEKFDRLYTQQKRGARILIK
ncbi:MAG: adenylate/guanylate cyclase domain-containing protein [Leptospira sp.]|nr:adenylate/guanylate cyclase domain-containing protein [Leptospira sp.]